MKQLISIFLMLAFLVSCSSDENSFDENMILDIDFNLLNLQDDILTHEVFFELNNYRKSKGLSPLRLDDKEATVLAIDHNLSMIKTKSINHDNFINRSRTLKFYGAKTVGEIVAWRYVSASTVLSAWSNSSSHNKVLTGNYTHCGIGICTEDNGNKYFTILFYRK